MIIGVLKEIKNNESRVAITPEGIRACQAGGHRTIIETGAGIASGIRDEDFICAGAEIAPDGAAVCGRADLVLKIKEPLPAEFALFRPRQMLFTFFHFASSRALTEAMVKASVTCIAYETVETAAGQLPLLAPMSEVAGKMAPLVAANYLARTAGGKGVLASAVGNAVPAKFVILGGGNAGRAAAEIALGIGAAVIIFERSPDQLRHLQSLFPRADCRRSDPEDISRQVQQADAVIGTVHVPGAKAPRLVTRDMVRLMEPGSVIVDIAIDQGGCIETSRPTTHAEPVYTESGIVHYCVTNMPGIFPRTATRALTGATLPYVLALAGGGMAAFRDPALLKGLNIHLGRVTNPGVAEAHGLSYTDPRQLLKQGSRGQGF